MPYGASISNLFINDTSGTARDIVLGWDNATYYTEDAQHPYFGPVVGKDSSLANSLDDANSFEVVTPTVSRTTHSQSTA